MRQRATPIILSAVLLAGLTGCTFTAPQTVQRPYDPSDGIGGNVGAVELRNALLISDNGTSANLSVSAINSGDRPVRLVVSWKDSGGDRVDRNMYVKAGGTLTVGGESNEFVLSDIETEPGADFPVYFQYGDEPGEQLPIPVLDGTLPEYSDLVPAS